MTARSMQIDTGEIATGSIRARLTISKALFEQNAYDVTKVRHFTHAVPSHSVLSIQP
jgi:hypothetical protein